MENEEKASSDTSDLEAEIEKLQQEISENETKYLAKVCFSIVHLGCGEYRW